MLSLLDRAMALDEGLDDDVDEHGLDARRDDRAAGGRLVKWTSAKGPDEREHHPDETEVSYRRRGVEDPVGRPAAPQMLDRAVREVVEGPDDVAQHRYERYSRISPVRESAQTGHEGRNAQNRQSGDGFGRKSPLSHARSIADHTADAR